MKKFSMESLSALVNTLSSIDDSSQKLMSKPFNPSEANLFAGPSLI